MPSRIFQRYPKVTLGVIVFILTITLDFGLTMAYYLFMHGTVHYKALPRTEIRIPSAVYHHALKPNAYSDKEGWGPLHPTMYTNSLGFRDKIQREVPLSRGQHRILIMGDSFSEGVGYDFELTFAGILAESLSRRGIDVLNAGVVGYSPVIYFKKAEYLLNTVGLKFDQMIVFLDISDIADEVKSYEIRNGETVLVPETHSYSGELVYRYSTISRNVLEFLSRTTKMMNDPEYRKVPRITRTSEDRRYGINEERSLWTVEKTFLEAYGYKGLLRAQLHMDRLCELLERHNIKLMLVVYPWPDQINRHDLNSLQVRFWRAWASRHSVRFVNLFPEFIKDGQSATDIIAEYYINGDTHWNDKGHSLVAHRILREL